MVHMLRLGIGYRATPRFDAQHMPYHLDAIAIWEG